MSTAPAILSNVYPTIPAEFLNDAVAAYDRAFSGLGGSLRMITVDKLGFVLRDGGATQQLSFNDLIVVFVGGSETNHAVWWEKTFSEDVQPTGPDLLWKMPTMDTFPAALPEQYRKKVRRGDKDVWAFQIRRRLAFLVAKRDAQGGLFLDYDNPYIMDLSSSSLFGPSFPDQNAYKWGAIKDLCAQMSMPGRPVLPFMFPMQIVPNASIKITGPVLFKPARDAQGNLSFLSNDALSRVMQVVTSESVRNMLDVQEKLTYGDNTSVQPEPVQAAPTPPPAQAKAPASTSSMLDEAAAILNGTGPAETKAPEKKPDAFDSVDALLGALDI